MVSPNLKIFIALDGSQGSAPPSTVFRAYRVSTFSLLYLSLVTKRTILTFDWLFSSLGIYHGKFENSNCLFLKVNDKTYQGKFFTTRCFLEFVTLLCTPRIRF